MAGNYGKALEYYQHTDFLKPDQKSIQMQMGHCMIELGKFKEALALFFKLDALEEEDIRVWRAISWCSFVSGNISQAAYYSQKIIEAEPTATDYLNAGHIAWCGGKLQEAIGYYQQNISLQNNKELFVQNLQEDKPHLLANGIDADEIPLLLDALNL
jgi:tetratricopeptide (TPR) repeat protein